MVLPIESDYANRTYNIDLCLCIDKTSSMELCFAELRKFVNNLDQDIHDMVSGKGFQLGELRIRFVLFGDYLNDPEPMIESPFYTSHDKESMLSFLSRINAEGGKDIAADGLEALVYGMHSDWCTKGWKKRHVIVLITDAPAHELGYSKKAATYPQSGMPDDFGQLSEMWGWDQEEPGIMNHKAKRLVLFTPNESFWHTIVECWENSCLKPITSSSDITYQSITKTIGYLL